MAVSRTGLRRAALGLASLVVITVPAACTSPSGDLPAGGSGIRFREVSQDVGIRFQHVNGFTGGFHLPEIMGAGAALFDADGDGDLDAYLVQSGALPWDVAGSPAFSGDGGSDGDRLFRNLLRETGELRFEDTTADAGIRGGCYGMGVASGDADSDGDVDLYITCAGPDRLLLNQGHGRFVEETAARGIRADTWTVPAAWVDLTGDGHLDLYVGGYVSFDPDTHRPCTSPAGIEDYCAPEVYPAAPDRLFVNDGAGRFRDVTASSGLGAASGRALGAVALDVDGDGLLDLYVANDGTENFLWMNQGGGAFREEAVERGVAVNMEGVPEASMGIGLGDVDRDGDPDLLLTHLRHETHTLYVNRGDGAFDDATLVFGLAAPSRAPTGFGTDLEDLDGDGWPDLLVVNGAVQALDELVRAGDPFPYHQRDQVFRNERGVRWVEVSARAGPYFTSESWVGRGAAFGDVDDDGDVDVLVSNNAGPARLLLNETPRAGAWIGVSLRPELPGRAQGARVTAVSSGSPVTWVWASSLGSYASASDPRALLFLPEGTEHVDVIVDWVGAAGQTFRGLAAGRYHTLGGLK